jgi:hypothetical protein
LVNPKAAPPTAVLKELRFVVVFHCLVYIHKRGAMNERDKHNKMEELFYGTPVNG